LRENLSERRAVKVSKWKNERALLEDLDCIIVYALVADRHVKRRKGQTHPA
jgi:hypothetical protein